MSDPEFYETERERRHRRIEGSGRRLVGRRGRSRCPGDNIDAALTCHAMADVTASSAAGRQRFETLCAPLRENILRYVKWLSGDTDVAQDIVQAALLRAWRSIHTLADDRAVTAWLQTIARRELARFHTRKRTENEYLAGLTRIDELAVNFEDSMAVDDLQTMLDSMKRGDRQILVGTMWGYSAEEIAASTGCTLGQSRVRLFRARRRLRCLMP